VDQLLDSTPVEREPAHRLDPNVGQVLDLLCDLFRRTDHGWWGRLPERERELVTLHLAQDLVGKQDRNVLDADPYERDLKGLLGCHRTVVGLVDGIASRPSTLERRSAAIVLEG
jgi:hypothetical protein